MYACQALKWLIEEESGKKGIKHAVSIGMGWEDIWFFVKQSQKRFIFLRAKIWREAENVIQLQRQWRQQFLNTVFS